MSEFTAGPRRREVAVLAAWPALTLGAGQGSMLLLLLLPHQSSPQGASSGQANTAAVAWGHRRCCDNCYRSSS